MSGTKHEKITLVVLAYIIGLTSGIVAFAFDMPQVIIKEVGPDATYYATAAEEETTETPVETEVPTEATNDLDKIVDYTDGKLYAMVGQSRYVLSVDRSHFGDSLPTAMTEQGIHTVPPSFTTSPDDRYIYFCEQHDTTGQCLSLVFDTVENVIHYVNLDGQKLLIASDVAATAVWGTDGLKIGNYGSVTIESPWVIAIR